MHQQEMATSQQGAASRQQEATHQQELVTSQQGATRQQELATSQPQGARLYPCWLSTVADASHGGCVFLTRAHNAGVFPVPTVVGSPGPCLALGKGGLRPGAAYVVQPDGVCSSPVASPANGR